MGMWCNRGAEAWCLIFLVHFFFFRNLIHFRKYEILVWFDVIKRLQVIMTWFIICMLCNRGATFDTVLVIMVLLCCIVLIYLTQFLLYQGQGLLCNRGATSDTILVILLVCCVTEVLHLTQFLLYHWSVVLQRCYSWRVPAPVLWSLISLTPRSLLNSPSPTSCLTWTSSSTWPSAGVTDCPSPASGNTPIYIKIIGGQNIVAVEIFLFENKFLFRQKLLQINKWYFPIHVYIFKFDYFYVCNEARSSQK